MGVGGGLMQSHVMAEHKTCWGEEEKGMEGERRKARQERIATKRVLYAKGICSTQQHYDG